MAFVILLCLCIAVSNTWLSRGWGERGFLVAYVMSHVTHALCLASLAVGPDHRARRATQTQEAPSPQLGLKTPLG